MSGNPNPSVINVAILGVVRMGRRHIKAVQTIHITKVRKLLSFSNVTPIP